MTNSEIEFLDLKSNFRIIAQHATLDTKITANGGCLTCSNLIIRSTADRMKLEEAGWRKRDSEGNEWFRDFLSSGEDRTPEKRATEIYAGYKEVFASFVKRAKEKLEERKAEERKAEEAPDGTIWVADDTTPVLVFSDDDGNDYDLFPGAGGIGLGEEEDSEEEEVEVQFAPIAPERAEPMVNATLATAENKVDKEKDKMRTIEIPIAAMAKVFAVLVVLGALAFGGYGMVTGKLGTDRQVVDVVQTTEMSIMTVEDLNGEWLVYVGNADKTESMFIRKSGEYGAVTWYDGKGRLINDAGLEVLFQADKIRKQADQVLYELEVITD